MPPTAPASAGGLPPQVAHIDAQLKHGWTESHISASAPATDREFCRRLFLDVLGRIPTVDELERYARDKQTDRKQRLVERVLYDETYTADYAAHWSTIWTNLLIGRAGNGDRNSPVDRAGLEKYLRDSFANNKPYDRLSHELISATGTNRPGSPEFNGAVNFLCGKLDDGATQATAQTVETVSGSAGPVHAVPQSSVQRVEAESVLGAERLLPPDGRLRRFDPGTREVRFIELTDQDFAGEDRPMDPEQARIYYELRNGTGSGVSRVRRRDTPSKPAALSAT